MAKNYILAQRLDAEEQKSALLQQRINELENENARLLRRDESEAGMWRAKTAELEALIQAIDVADTDHKLKLREKLSADERETLDELIPPPDVPADPDPNGDI